MAPSALLPELTILEAPVSEIAAPKAKYNDWRADLLENGYSVVKGAVPYETAKGYQEKAYEWLKSFENAELDFNNPET